MKNRIINYSIWGILSFLFLLACQTGIQNELEEKVNTEKTSLSVEDAKRWLSENYSDVLNINTSGARIAGDKLERDVKWNKGIEKQIKTSKGVVNVVIFPVKIKNQKDILEDASLWVMNENGTIYSKFLELYNADYRKMKKKDAKQQNYKQQFTGSLNIYDIKDGLEMGHYYENGKISGTVMSFDGEKASLTTTKKNAKTNWCYPKVNCPDVETQSIAYVSSTGVPTVTVGRCIYVWACEQYFIYNGDPSFDDLYWAYFWLNVEMASNNHVDIVSNITNPCLKSRLSSLIVNNNLSGKIASIMRDRFNVVGERPFITYVQGNFGSNNVPAQTQKTGPGSYNVVLNEDVLANASLEFISLVILHEAIHISLYESGFPGSFQHDNILLNYVNDLANELRGYYPNLSQSDARGLALSGLRGSDFNIAAAVASSLGVGMGEVDLIEQRYKHTGQTWSGTPCP
jgi:hypothetical protein